MMPVLTIATVAVVLIFAVSRILKRDADFALPGPADNDPDRPLRRSSRTFLEVIKQILGEIHRELEHHRGIRHSVLPTLIRVSYPAEDARVLSSESHRKTATTEITTDLIDSGYFPNLKPGHIPIRFEQSGTKLKVTFVFDDEPATALYEGPDRNPPDQQPPRRSEDPPRRSSAHRAVGDAASPQRRPQDPQPPRSSTRSATQSYVDDGATSRMLPSRWTVSSPFAIVALEEGDTARVGRSDSFEIPIPDQDSSGRPLTRISKAHGTLYLLDGTVTFTDGVDGRPSTHGSEIDRQKVSNGMSFAFSEAVEIVLPDQVVLTVEPLATDIC